MPRSFRGKPKTRWPKKIEDNRPLEEIIQELRAGAKPAHNYRDQSLRIHGMICAKCGREFGPDQRHLLTVHHRDGNANNNPPDGSNWENLCVYCHEDEHSRSRLGDYLNRGKDQK